MHDLIILTGISLRRNPKMSLRQAWSLIREKAVAAGVAFGIISFLAILLGFEFFGSIMAMVSLTALWMSEEGGTK